MGPSRPHPDAQLVDMVNHPPHYNQGGIETIVAVKAQLTSEEYRGFLKGTIAVYMWRERHKNGNEDIKKANWFMQKLLEELADGGA